jgi:hypothetical protein
LKKLAAILLIGILFFNWYGYRLLTNYWQQQATRRLESRIQQNDYDESSLISIKLPIKSLSYYNPSNEWERLDGQIIISDVAYQYVKRRITGDSLELLCLRNTEETELGKAGNEFFGKVNNFPNSKPAQQKDFQKLFSPETQTAVLIAPGPIKTPRAGYLTPQTLPGHAPRAMRPPTIA